ncbi:FecR family protein [Carboxylicivirga sp. RSCT41]|uniref:FecR family protein n=1 Tax=Carboxylicivirga agarovorans TaxID=3417570 RepID=UPI003D34A181
MKDLNDIEALIIRSLDKTATEEELTTLREWIDKSGENKQLYFEFKDVWDASAIADMPSQKQAWQKLKPQLKSRKVIPVWALEVAKIAAVALLAVFATYSIFKLPQSGNDQLSYVTFTVPNGSQSSVKLSDGTLVKLNAGSELVYPSVFYKEARNVTLKGEAYFSVHHDKEHPFIVSVGEIEVRVLGTEFNVMAYPETNRIETTLVEGSVSLNKKGTDHTKGIILKPGQKAIYADGQMNVDQADVDFETNWTQRGFNFRNTSFDDLITRLERWYDVDIIILSDEVRDLSFTGKFRNNETIWQVLDVIKMTTPIDYRSDNDKIYITLITD